MVLGSRVEVSRSLMEPQSRNSKCGVCVDGYVCELGRLAQLELVLGGGPTRAWCETESHDLSHCVKLGFESGDGGD